MLYPCSPGFLFLLRRIIAFTAKANFWFSVAQLAVMILGHLIFYLQLNKTTCDTGIYTPVSYLLYLWDGCIAIFLYLRYRG